MFFNEGRSGVESTAHRKTANDKENEQENRRHHERLGDKN